MRPAMSPCKVSVTVLRAQRQKDDARLIALTIPEAITLGKELGVQMSQVNQADVVINDQVWVGPRSGAEFYFSHIFFEVPKLRAEQPDEVDYLVLRRSNETAFDAHLIPAILACSDLDRLEADEHEEAIDEIVSHCIRSTFSDETGKLRMVDYPSLNREVILKLRDYCKFCLHTVEQYFASGRFLVCVQDRQREGFALLRFTQNGEDNVFVD